MVLLARLLLGASLLVAALGLGRQANAQVTFIDLEPLPLGGCPPNSGPLDLSDDGQVVVGGSTSPNASICDEHREAFRWTESTGLVGLGDLPGGYFDSNALVTSADGSVVAGASQVGIDPDFPFLYDVFHWTAGTGLTALGFAGDVFGLALSADGSILAASNISALLAPATAFRWTLASGPVPLGDLGGSEAGTAGISADGSVIVGSSTNSSGDKEAFRWTQSGGMVGLGDLSGGLFRSGATAVSGDGLVIVGWGTTGTTIADRGAFVWTTAGGMVGLGDLGQGGLR